MEIMDHRLRFSYMLQQCGASVSAGLLQIHISRQKLGKDVQSVKFQIFSGKQKRKPFFFSKKS